MEERKGLSPRLRGNELDTSPHVLIIGSIPALAGEREANSTDDRSARVYPRACGGTF